MEDHNTNTQEMESLLAGRKVYTTGTQPPVWDLPHLVLFCGGEGLYQLYG